MTTALNFGSDVKGSNAYAPRFSNSKWSATLAATTDTTLTVPSDKASYIAVFEPSPGATIYVANGATAAAPAGASFASTTSECNPAAREVSAGDVLHFFTPDTGSTMTVVFYSNSAG
jgi:hypothetical protein